VNCLVSSLVYTPHKQKGSTPIGLGRVLCEVFSRKCLARQAESIKHCSFFKTLACCVLREVFESMLALGRCKKSWGVARVKAVSPVCWQLLPREELPSLFFLSSLMCRPWGIVHKRKRNKVYINPSKLE
jgi:hypothetical protein